MASTSTKPKSKDTDNTARLGQGYVRSSSSSSPVEAASNLFEEEPFIEQNSESGCGKISQTPSAVAAEASDPGIRTRFKQVMDELRRTVVNPGFFPVIKRPKPKGGAIRRKAVSEPIPRTARYIDDREPLIQSERFGGHQYLGSDEPAEQEFSSRKNSNENRPPRNRNEGRPLQGSHEVRPLPHRTLKQRYFDYSIYASNSPFIVPFLLLLFGLGCFTCFMGIQYFDQCELLNESPILFVLMGVSSMAGLLTRIVYVLTKRRMFARFEVCRLGTMAAILTFGMCFAAESVYYMVSKGYPCTEKGPGYCHPFFYGYVYWYNWTVLGIIFILVVVHGPNSCHYL